MKTQTKHTPGPWDWYRTDSGVVFIGTKVEKEERRYYALGEALAEVFDLNGTKSRDEQNANASLIAAAPRMASALYRIAEVFGINDVSLNDEQRDALHEAALAYDEAEGGNE